MIVASLPSGYSLVAPPLIEPAAAIGHEHETLERFLKASELAGGAVNVGLSLPRSFMRGVALPWRSHEGRRTLGQAAKWGAILGGGAGACVGLVTGGPIGLVTSALQGAALGATCGVISLSAVSGGQEAARTVGPAWVAGAQQGYDAASNTVSGCVDAIVWIGQKSPRLHAFGLFLERLGEKEPTGHEQERAHQVDTNVYRSAQPGPLVWKDLKARGYKSVVNLRWESNDEHQAVLDAGLQAYFIPESPLKEPTVAQALDFLKFVTDPNNQPVLFHCYSGVDRTGSMAACYRIAVQGWTQEQALKEALELGMVKELQRDKIRFIMEFNRAWQQMQKKGTAPHF